MARKPTRRFELAKDLKELPRRNLTVLMLRSLDLIAPNHWTNPRDFDALLRRISAERSTKRLCALRSVCERLWQDDDAGYRQALRVYQLVDSGDRLIGAASLASQVGERVEMLRFLRRITPKTDTLQAVDLIVKLGAEAVAFGYLRGRTSDGVVDFGKSLATYTGENMLRVSALICIDGLIPLGPEFADRAADLGGRVKRSDLAGSKVFY